MKNKRILLLSLSAVLLMLLVGCTKPYVITRDLEEPVYPRTTCSIGLIDDELPLDMDEDQKPSMENIYEFKEALREELLKTEVFDYVEIGTDKADYEVNGALMDYKKGSWAGRFFIGFGVGNAKFSTNLKLIDKATGNPLFAGNFTRTISGWGESGSDSYKKIAKDFAKAFKKQLKKLQEDNAELFE